MRGGLVATLAIVVVLGAVPLASADEDTGEDDETECIHPPDVEETYQWVYEASNGRTRIVEILHEGLASTPIGNHNVTQVRYTEVNDAGQKMAWGQLGRLSAGSPAPWGLVASDHRESTEEGELRRQDTYNPPFRVIHRGSATCPGDRWDFRTEHTIVYGRYGRAGNDQGEETWQVQALDWTNVSVPAGELEVLPVIAERESDAYRIETFWSPEARAPAMVAQGLGPTEDSSRELVEYILDQRPAAFFAVRPQNPRVGDTITLDARPSFDPDGNITDYHWIVGEENHTGAVVELNVSEERTLPIHLSVRDDADRVAKRARTIYVGPAQGSGVAVSGPTEAREDEVVSLEAHASFDPVEIRWREGSTVVGEGPTYRFYMNETRTLHADAFHPSGRVETANHTVELVQDDADGEQDASRERSRAYYPPGATDELAIIDPLEGQIVPTRFQVEVRAQDRATLMANDRPVWQGTTNGTERVDVHLEPGDHTLTLQRTGTSQTVNVTVAEGGTIAADGDARTSEDDASSSGSSPTPAPSTLLVVALVALVSGFHRRADRGRP